MEPARSSVRSNLLLDLPDELLQLLSRTIGLGDALNTLAASHKLHVQWQQAVRSVTVSSSQFTDEDVAALCKLVNLEKLHITRGVSIHQWNMPLKRVIRLIAPALTKLKRLKVDQLSGATSLMETIAASGFRSRLEELLLHEPKADVSTEELWPLAEMTALRHFDLRCQAISGSTEAMRSICRQLNHLRSLHLSSARSEKLRFGANLESFPGSLTGLTWLKLENAQLKEEQFAEAVSGLTNLRRLSTDLALCSSGAQEQALGLLRKLTELQLGSSGRLYHPPYVYVLQDLPELVILRVAAHIVEDPFDHPCLEALTALKVLASEYWTGQVSAECKLREITVNGHDTDLKSWPLLPKLGSLHCSLEPKLIDDPDDFTPQYRYLHLAELLHRQAGTLVLVDLAGCSRALEERLLLELPVCTQLRLLQASSRTLGFLSLCRLPQLLLLRQLRRGVVLPVDLAWLKELPALREVRLGMGPSGLLQHSDEQEVEVDGPEVAAVQRLLAGREVRVLEAEA